jgi:hypothetical protein
MAWLKKHFSLKARIALGMLLIGCNAQMIRVELPHGYSGNVRIDCGMRKSEVQTITVDATGHVTDAACPEKPAKLVIVRDGNTIQSIEPTQWVTTGDGLTSFIEFTVQ